MTVHEYLKGVNEGCKMILLEKTPVIMVLACISTYDFAV